MPLRYAVYKGKNGRFGAVQFSLQNPYCYNSNNQKDFTGKYAIDPDNGRLKPGWKTREGAIFVEITSTKSPDVYDWDNKIIMALSVNDMGKMLLGLSRAGKTSIMHDPHAQSDKANQVKKFLNIEVSDQGAMLYCTQTKDGNKTSHTVPLSPDEVVILRALLTKAISNSLNW